MNEVLRLIRAVRRRVYCNYMLEHLVDAAFVAVSALCLVVLVIKLVFFPDALVLLLWAACLAAAAVLVYSALLARLGLLRAAMAADEGLRLAERLSSALLVCSDTGAMAQAVVADARERAAAARHAKSFPISLPQRWWRAATALVALTLVLALPQFDIFGRQAEHRRRQQEAREVVQQLDKAIKKLQEFKKTVAKSDLETTELLEMHEAKLAELQKKGASEKEALAAVSKSLEDIAQRMKEVAKQLANKGQEGTEGLSGAADKEALKKAAEEIAKMQKALESGGFKAEEGEKFGKALEQLAKQFSQQAQAAQEQLEKMKSELEKGGLSAEDAEKLAQAMEKLAQMAANSQQLSGMLSQAAASLKAANLPGALANLQTALGGFENALAAMESGLSPGEAAQQLAQMAQGLQGLDQLKAGLTGTGSMSLAEAMEALAMAGNMAGQGGRGPGMGGPGMGEGNTWDKSDQATDTQSSTIKGDMRKGTVLASFYTEGGQLKNESRVEYQEIVLESAEKAKEALSEQKIPRAYRSTVKNYFESLQVPE